MKQTQPKVKSLNGNTYFIRPFPAFKAAHISGELFSVLLPMIGSIAPAAAKALRKGSDDSVMDENLDITAIAQGLSSLSGDKVELLLKKLLIHYQNIAVEPEGETVATPLTEAMANELFCGEAQDMFILAAEVIKVNYSSFFSKIGTRFGELIDAFKNKMGMPEEINTES